MSEAQRLRYSLQIQKTLGGLMDRRTTEERRKIWQDSILAKYGSMERFKEESAKYGSQGGKAKVPKGVAHPGHPLHRKKKE